VTTDSDLYKIIAAATGAARERALTELLPAYLMLAARTIRSVFPDAAFLEVDLRDFFDNIGKAWLLTVLDENDRAVWDHDVARAETPETLGVEVYWAPDRVARSNEIAGAIRSVVGHIESIVECGLEIREDCGWYETDPQGIDHQDEDRYLVALPSPDAPLPAACY
jgi:hypothetical protein